MATFTNQATLTYNGGTVNSNIVTGELRAQVLTASKTAAAESYRTGDLVTYVVQLRSTRCGGADRADRDRHARHDELSCHGRHGAAHAADVSGGDAPLFHERRAADGPGRHGTGKRHPHRRNQRSRRRRYHAGLYGPRQCLCRSLGRGHDREHRDRHRRAA